MDGGMDAAVSIALRRRRRGGVLQSKTPMPKSGRTPDLGKRKGLQRYPFLPQAKKIQA
jgi:hypothetical protein